MAPVEHAVIFKFTEGTTDAQIAEFFADARGMMAQIPGIARFVGGANISGEGLSRDFTHMFIMTFEDAAARDAYLPHDAHEAFKAKWVPSLAKIFVMDI